MNWDPSSAYYCLANNFAKQGGCGDYKNHNMSPSHGYPSLANNFSKKGSCGDYENHVEN